MREIKAVADAMFCDERLNYHMMCWQECKKKNQPLHARYHEGQIILLLDMLDRWYDEMLAKTPGDPSKMW